MHEFYESRIHYLHVKAKNAMSEGEAIATLWIQNPFDSDRVTISHPAMIAALKINETDELGEGNCVSLRVRKSLSRSALNTYIHIWMCYKCFQCFNMIAMLSL